MDSFDNPSVISFDQEELIIRICNYEENKPFLSAGEVFDTFVKKQSIYSQSKFDAGLSRVRFVKTPSQLHFKLKLNESGATARIVLKTFSSSKVLTYSQLLPLLKVGYLIENEEGSHALASSKKRHWVPLSKESIVFALEFVPKLKADGTLALKDALVYFTNRHQLKNVLFDVDDLNVTSLKSAEKPYENISNFERRLYDYQKDGFLWLRYCCLNRIGGILGDDMGLGKTAQIIALIAWCIEKKIFDNILVVVPATLMENWKREFAFFAPSLSVYVHQGAIRTGAVSTLKSHQIVITSYSLVINDKYLFNKINWGLTVLDEASLIKNPSSERRTSLVMVPSEVRIAMTGTPIENSLMDLWSIGDFVNPGYFGTKAEFESRYIRKSIDETLELGNIGHLRESASLIMLRRKKEDVLESLPERIDIHQALTMTGFEATIYEDQRQAIQSVVNSQSSASFLTLISVLRQVTSHPFLLDKNKLQKSTFEDLARVSAKFTRTLEILAEIQQSNEKVIIFTEYLDMVDALKDALRLRFNINVFTIDGRVEMHERQLRIDSFSAEVGFAVMVLNPKTAGMGLNITAANHVIHYTRQWNPALEEQASARAYRNGQNRAVNIYYLYYVDSIEEVIDQRLKAKKKLSGEIISESLSDITIEEYLEALRKSPLNQ